MVEVCEARTLLANFLVVNSDNSSTGSLRWAIQQANLNPSNLDTIEFQAGLSPIGLTTPLDPIVGPVVVNSTNRNDVTIDGGGTLHGFTLAAGSGGSTIQGLSIGNFTGAAIRILSDDNQILGNTLGGASATVAQGVLIEGGSDNVIGAPGSGNTIGFATTAGVQIQGSSASGNEVSANLIGTDALAANRGGPIGVLIAGASGNFVGGAATADGNVIGHSSTAGVQIAGAGATGNVVRNNFIGVDRNDAAVGNRYGVEVSNAAGNRIGEASAGNRIGNSSAAGVHIVGSGSTGNVIAANVLGATSAGAAAANQFGVLVDGASSTTIGGDAGAGAGNTIDASLFSGVQITDSSGVRVLGNTIGLKGTVDSLRNGYGVQITNSSGSDVGGTGAGEGNSIGYSRLAGVNVSSGATNRILRNTYVGSNGGPTPADDIEVNPPANNGIVPPTLAEATLSGTTLTIRFTAASTAGTVVEVYRIDAGSPNRRVFVGSGTVQPASLDRVAISGVSVDPGTELVATATRTASGTSRFSNAVLFGDPSKVITNVGQGVGSLAWVINNVNRNLTDRIEFELAANERTILVTAGSPLPPLIRPATTFILNGAEDITIQGSGPGSGLDGLVLAAGSGGSEVTGLTFVGFAGAGIRVLDSGSANDRTILRDVVLRGNGVGVSIEGSFTTVTGGSRIENSTIAGVRIDGEGSSDNIIEDTTFVRNTPQGLALVSGNRNVFRRNTYFQNGPLIGGTYRLEAALFVGPQTNDGIGPAQILSVGQATDSVVLQLRSFTRFAEGTDQDVELSRVTADGATSFLTASTRFEWDEVLGYGSARVTFPTSTSLVGDTLAVTITGDPLEESANIPGLNTSSFSNQVLVVAPNVVLNTLDYDESVPESEIPNSLRAAIHYVSMLPAGTPAQDRRVIFRIPEEDKTAGRWEIDLLSEILVTGMVSIEGWNTSAGFTITPGQFVEPTVRLSPASAAATRGLVFATGSQGSVVQSLRFEGFSASAIAIATDEITVQGNVLFGSATADRVAGVGISIASGSRNLVGGYTAALRESLGLPTEGIDPRNVMGRFRTAVLISGAGSNYVVGNRIGTDGFTAYRNIDGISVVDSIGNVILANLIGESRYDSSLDGGTPPPESLGAGVRISGSSRGSWIAANSIGVGLFRENFDVGNQVGLSLESSGNVVGVFAGPQGPIVGTENVIGFNQHGVILTDEATSNVLNGNYIGTDANRSRFRNVERGVWIRGGSGNQIGLTGHELYRNVIGWNGTGIRLDGTADSNILRNNYIGTAADGSPLRNDVGLALAGGAGNVIGTDASAPALAWDPTGVVRVGANFISGNGVGIEVDAGFGAGNQLQGNVIGAYLNLPGNQGAGVSIKAGTGLSLGGVARDLGAGPALPIPGPAPLTPGLANVIAGNENGVAVAGEASRVRIEGNWIYGNRLNGVVVTGAMGGEARRAWISGNFIGTSFDGTSNRTQAGNPTGNGLSGVLLNPTEYAPVRAVASTWAIEVAANLISGNGLNGVGIDSLGVGEAPPAGEPAPTGFARVLIVDNIIGLGLGGSAEAAPGAPIGNALDGVRIINVGGVQVGARPSGSRGWSNVISGNLGRGVEVFWSGAEAASGDQEVRIFRNFLGAGLDGRTTGPDGAGTGNLAAGVFLFGDARATIEGNRIAGNRGAGVQATGAGTFRGYVSIQRNHIGTDPDGGDYFNSSDGIFLDMLRRPDLGDASETARIADNLIGANRGNGITIQDSRGVWIRGNQVGSVGQISGDSQDERGNLGNGIFLNGSSRITIGGPEFGQGNVISGNRATGVVVSEGGENAILGNHIGVALDGVSQVPNFSSGLIVSSSSRNRIGVLFGDEVVGNVISGNRLYGVLIAGATEGTNIRGVATLNVVAGNRIGTDRSGRVAVANSSDGLFLLNTSANVIGGVDEASRNIISGNEAQGVRIFGARSRGNQVASNYVGVGADGSTPIRNQGNGVIIDNAGPNDLGVLLVLDPAGRPTEVVRGNVISGNAQSGLVIANTNRAPSGTRVFGNLIGLDAGGTSPVENDGSGVVVSGAGDVQIGLPAPDKRNWISGNLQSGIVVSGAPTAGAAPSILGNTIGLNRAGDRALGNGGSGVQIVGASGVQVGYNVISANAVDGVQIFSPVAQSPADRNRIVGNFIGTDAAGTGALGNRGVGVDVVNGHGNIVGGATRNVISGNGAHGVVVDFQANRGFEGAGNVVDGNYIGLDRSGSARLGNGQFGVLLNNAADTVVGYATGIAGLPTVPGTLVPAPGRASNVISGNGAAGVVLTGSTTGTRVRGSYIGVDAQGRAFDDAGAGLDLFSRVGVLIESRASNNWIGGLIDGEAGVLEGTGNIITQSASSRVPDLLGVQVDSPEALGNRIQSNLIGLDAQGRSGSNSIGVLLANAQDVRVGGYRPNQPGIGTYSPLGNVITGNALAGVEIIGSLATRNVLVNNFIGTDVAGLGRPAPRFAPTQNPLYNPSQESGVLIVQGSGNTVGAVNAGNLISGNRYGVNIASLDADAPASSRNVVQGNTIGTDVTGMRALPNFQFGVFITAASDNLIDANLISANGLAGVEIFGGRSQLGGSGTAASLGNTITANRIGVNAAGRVAFAVTDGSQTIGSIADHPEITLPDGIVVNYGFQSHGVVVIGSSGNRIGLPGQDNVISGNILTGVYISRRDNALNLFALPVDNVVQSNDLDDNGVYGVFRYDAPNGNPAAEPPASNANSFVGTPIPIGDFVTGIDVSTPQTRTQSILLGPTGGAPRGPRRTPRRPAALGSSSLASSRPALARPALAQLAQARRPR